jgi:sulfur transfer complex TusBCD TusB component (DsrH family)
MKVLQIIETAYRATTEEQDDTVVWITHAMRGAGAELAVLLCGNAVNYVVTEQDSSGLRIGAWSQAQPPRIAQDVAGLLAKAVAVYCVKDDLADRGLLDSPIVEGVALVPRSEIAALFERFDQVWRW